MNNLLKVLLKKGFGFLLVIWLLIITQLPTYAYPSHFDLEIKTAPGYRAPDGCDQMNQMSSGNQQQSAQTDIDHKAHHPDTPGKPVIMEEIDKQQALKSIRQSQLKIEALLSEIDPGPIQ